MLSSTHVSRHELMPFRSVVRWREYGCERESGDKFWWEFLRMVSGKSQDRFGSITDLSSNAGSLVTMPLRIQQRTPLILDIVEEETRTADVGFLCKADRIFNLGDVVKRALGRNQWGPTR
jgi:hypothetical protein